MTEKKQTEPGSDKNTARRRLIKSAVAGGGVLATGKLLPENWVAPVVRPVVLPAHGQTSPGVTGVFSTPGLSFTINNQTPSILDHFVAPAYAQGGFQVGSVVFQAQWTVNENNAELCIAADGGPFVPSLDDYLNSDVIARNGDTLADSVMEPFEFTDQQVSESGVNFTVTESIGGGTGTFTATPGAIGCGNVFAMVQNSSPYGDDEDIV